MTPQPKKKLAFLLAATSDLLFAAANVAIGLNKHVSEKDFDILIYANGGAEIDLAALRCIDHVKVVDYQLDPDFVSIMMKGAQEGSRLVKTPGHLLTFAHFEIYALLETYRHVVWLDVDMLVQDNIDEAIGAPFAITLDDPWTVGANFLRPIQGYQMDAPGVCAAVIVVNDELPYSAMYLWCFDMAARNASALKNSDQGITNLALQQFAIKPKLLPLTQWQCMAWRNEASLAKLIHFGGGEKVWKEQLVCDAFPQWYVNHLEWLRLGGSSGQTQVGAPNNVLSRLRQLNELLASADHSKRPVDIEMVERLVHIEQKVDELLRGRG
jgi:hypothetical protein